MKKLICIALALCLALSFTACFDSTNPEDISGDEATQTPLLTPTPTPEAEPEFSMGTTSGLTYENKFIGIGCKLKSGWSFYSDTQIKELNNVTKDMAGEEFKQAMENATIVYDMYASSSNQVDSINVNLEKVDPKLLANLDVSKNLENSFSLIKQSLENIGYTNVSYKMGTVSIEDKSFVCMTITSQIQGINFYQKSICIKCNGYLANVTLSSLELDTINDLVESFYLVK